MEDKQSSGTKIIDLFDAESGLDAAKFPLRAAYPDFTTVDAHDVPRGSMTFMQRYLVVGQLRHEAQHLLTHATALEFETEALIAAGQLSREDDGFELWSVSDLLGGR